MAGTRQNCSKSVVPPWARSAIFSNHYSADSDDKNVKKFVADYAAAYGHKPDALAAMGFDAAQSRSRCARPCA